MPELGTRIGITAEERAWPGLKLRRNCALLPHWTPRNVNKTSSTPHCALTAKPGGKSGRNGLPLPLASPQRPIFGHGASHDAFIQLQEYKSDSVLLSSKKRALHWLPTVKTGIVKQI